MKNLGVFIVLVAAVGANLVDETDKLFGVGHGPVFLGGSEAGQQRTYLALEAYDQLINYKRRIGEYSLDEQKYYNRWTARDSCIGACPRHSYCKDGLCVCNHDH